MIKETRQEKAYVWILDRIKKQEFAPGKALKEESLAREIGISATPVREALRRLEREGWLESFPYKGCFVRQYSPDEIRELCLLRQSVEEACISEIIKNITPEDMALLKDVIKRSEDFADWMEKSGEINYSVALQCRGFDAEFHKALARASHCRKLTDLAETWNVQIQGFALRPYVDESFILESLHNFSCVIDQHKAIVTSIRLKWEAAARELLRAHISTAMNKLAANLVAAKNEKAGEPVLN